LLQAIIGATEGHDTSKLVEEEAGVKQLVLLAIALFVSALAAGCGSPSTPIPPTPTGGPTAAPTANFRATEAVIIAHVFGTMTASAPTATKPPPPTATSAARPTATPRPRVTAAPTRRAASPTPAAPKPTTDPILSQIPKGKGGILVINYFGDKPVVFSIASTQRTVDPQTQMLILVDPGSYNYSVQVPGVRGGSWSAKIDVPKDNYVTFPVSLDTIP
jgi:hypothetical protein